MLLRGINILFIALLLSFSSFGVSFPGKPINIWEGTECGKKVKLIPFLANHGVCKEAADEKIGSDEKNIGGNVGIIVCPGGSYFWHDMKTEGIGVAEWLQSLGISAFVLEYRVGGIAGFITHHRLLARGNRYPDMLQDVQRAIMLLRENPEKYGVDPNKIGVMGFSAGGHLAAMSALFFDSDVLSEVGVKTDLSLRPDFVASIYPVVSMVDRSTHKRSRRGLLGEGKAISREMKDSLSLERHVRPDMPPVYLMNCIDDPIVKYRNSELFDSAMNAKGVNHRYVQYKTGGHGFGATASKTSAEAAVWTDDFIKWLKKILK